MTSSQILQELEGQEISALTIGRVIEVIKGKVVFGEEELKVTASQIRGIWEDYLYQKEIGSAQGGFFTI